jgi:hypothetical protein
MYSDATASKYVMAFDGKPCSGGNGNSTHAYTLGSHSAGSRELSSRVLLRESRLQNGMFSGRDK